MNDQATEAAPQLDAEMPDASSAASPRRTLRWWRKGSVLIGAAVTVLAAVSIAFVARRAEEPVQYTTAAVTRGNVVRAVSTSGTVNPELTIIVGSYVSGVIQQQFCDFNTRVKKGQICAKIDPRPFQTVVDQAKAALSTARAQLVKDQATLAYAKISFERNSGLLARGIVSQDTVDSAKSAFDQAQAQVELDVATIQQREAELAAAQVNLDYTNIVSPVDGTVVSRNITIGQTVASSFQTPTLFLIATDLTKMEVDTNVSESDIGGVAEGDRATFTVEAFPNRTFEGTVVQVRQAPQTVQNVVTYDVVIGVSNKDLMLKPGMTATTRIIAAEKRDVLHVPDQALRFTPAGVASASAPSSAKGGGSAARPSSVWVLREGRLQEVPITTGLDDDSYTEVVTGDLRVGDEVVIGTQRATATRESTGPRLFGR